MDLSIKYSARAVYTDVWASMGQENEAAERRRYFVPYQVNDKLMQKARPDAVFMHCLPAKRGEEVHKGCGPGDAHPSTANSRDDGHHKYKGAPMRPSSMPRHSSLAIRIDA